MTEIHAFRADGTPSPGALAALDGGYTRKPPPTEREYWVTPRGDDESDGLTLSTALRTIPAAVATLAGEPGTIRLGAGAFTLASDVQITNNLRIIGAGRHLTTVSYVGTGAAVHGTAGSRTYNFEMSGLHLRGPGKSTASTGIDLVDMSQAAITDFLISQFGVGVRHRSETIGGSVYNTFTDGFFTSCGTGALFQARGSNGSRWSYVKWGACEFAVDIEDSNQNNFHACQFEVNGTAVRLDASQAGTSDHNSFDHCRFERNGVTWNIVDPKVRFTSFTWPAGFDTLVTVDNGTRTNVLAASSQLEPPTARRQILTRSGDYSIAVGDEVVIMNAASTTATLPSAAAAKAGRTYTIKNPRNASTVTIASNAGQIDNQATLAVPALAAVRVISDGVDWWSI